MHVLHTTLLILVLSSHSVFGQKEVIANEPVERVFRNASESSGNFYVVLEPKIKPIGLILILPGYGSFPRAILEGSDLPSKARKKGYVVVIPYLGIGTFYLDSTAQQNLKTLVPEILFKYNISRDKFIIGGHSAGGNAALLYAAQAFQSSGEELVRPVAAFGVDPPLDMKRFRNTVAHEIKINFRKNNVKGMNDFLKNFESIFGGPPSLQGRMYKKYSTYYRDAEDGGNTKYLKSLPIRLYCDPDVNWAIENLRVGYEHLNASDLSACIAQLKLLGNSNAELIINLGKGYFGDTRHPHGMSQLESKDFLSWLGRVVKKSEMATGR
jgi:hypothetical protein